MADGGGFVTAGDVDEGDAGEVVVVRDFSKDFTGSFRRLALALILTLSLSLSLT